LSRPKGEKRKCTKWLRATTRGDERLGFHTPYNTEENSTGEGKGEVNKIRATCLRVMGDVISKLVIGLQRIDAFLPGLEAAGD